MQKNNPIRIINKNEKEHKSYFNLLSYVITEMLAKNEIQFYGTVVNFFEFRFLDEGFRRPDFDVGVFIEGSRVIITINPEVFFEKSASEQIYRLIHEVEHILRGDILFDPKADVGRDAVVTSNHKYKDPETGEVIEYEKKIPLAAMAMDLAVNSLKYSGTNASNYKRGNDYLLQDGIFPKEGKFKDLEPYQLWEWYYEKIYEWAEDGKNGFGMGKGGNGDITAPADAMPGVSNNDWAGGNPDGSINPADAKNVTAFINDVITQAADRCAGNIPSKYKSYLENLKKVHYDWKQQLRRFIARGVSPELTTSKRKVNRRAIPKKAIMPGYVSKKDVNIVVALDTSGSVSRDEFKAFVSHVNLLRKTTNAEVRVYCFDAEVHYDEILAKNNLKKVMEIPYTGGGTLFYPIFARVMELKRRPDVLIIFTDGLNFDEDQLRRNPIPTLPVCWVYPMVDHRPQSWGFNIKIKQI